jgi:signal transduction histidine kinase
VLSELQQLQATADRHLASFRGFLLTGDDALLRSHRDATDFDAGVARIAALTSDNQPQVARIRAVADSYGRWQLIAEREAAALGGDAQRAAFVRRGEAVHASVRAQLDVMRRVEERLRIDRTTRADRVRRQTMIVASVVGALLAIVLATAAVRSLMTLAAGYERSQDALRAEAAKLAEAERQLRIEAVSLERRVHERTAELERANAQLEAFGYSVSHDLRAPLRGMQGLAQALVEDYGERLDATGRAYASRVVDEAALMDTLIQDLLAYARISRVDVALESVALSDALAAATHNVAADVARSGAEIVVAPDLPAVRANRAILIQVFTNLLSNAIKFGGERASVLVWAERHAGKVRVWVADHGIGIKPEDRERIFRVFERLHGADEYPGTGIGLAIVRQAMDRLNGAVGVESTPGKGSRFWIELPEAAG